jgi:hypothetical protein
MIKQILILLSQGTLTIAEIAHEMNMSKEDVMNHFEMMERMGYLEKSTITATTDRIHEPGRVCAFCPEAKRCLSKKTICGDGIYYQMTPKGKKIIINS